MSKLYHNVTESIVEDVFDEVKGKLDCCMCERCQADLFAYALNQLPPRYVASKAGEAAVKVQSMSFQQTADVKAALYKGADLVREHPRHEE